MARKVRVDSGQYAQRWGDGLKGSVERIREGVGRVTESPGLAAAKAADKWHTAISAASTKAKWQRRIGAMTLTEWQHSMTEKGINRIASGVDAATPKMVAYGEALIAYQNKLLAELETKPDITLEDNIARMTFFIRGMAKMQY